MASMRGGKRQNAGRKAGAKSKATKEVKQTLESMAREYAPNALKTLATICDKGQSEAARVAAATALLDRGFGKPKQLIAGAGEGSNPVKVELSIPEAGRALAFMLAAAAAQ